MSLPITPEHILDIVNVSEPVMAPDSSNVALTKSWIDRETMEKRSHIVVAPAGGEPRQFTNGKSDSSPEFSPDGKTIAFVRPDDKGRKQLWLIPVSGGEARKVTDVAGGAVGHAWSPDSKSLVFVSKVDPDRLPDGHDSKKDPRPKVVRRLRYRYDGTGWLGDSFKQLFVADVQSGKSQQITHGEGDHTWPSWSPDGSRIAFISDEVDGRDFTNCLQAFVISAAGGEAKSWSPKLSNVWALTWSPDSQSLAAIGSHDFSWWDPRQAWLYVLQDGKPHRMVTDGAYTPVYDAPELRWTDDGRLVFVGVRKGQSFVCEVPAAGGRLRTITGGAAQYLGLAMDRQARKAVTLTLTPETSGEIEQHDLAGDQKRPVTTYNTQYFKDHPTAKMEKFTITRGGQEIETRVFLPQGFDPGRKYPLVLDIHGGPNGRFADTFDSVYQVLASAGYITIAPNPRGSSSYGPEFARMVLGDWGGEDYLDLMAAVEEMRNRPYVDADRVGVHGFSYGGFMGSWMVGHTKLFKAAVVGAPCINLHSMYGTSDIGVSFGEINWGGVFTEATQKYLERSPLMYVQNVETPVLLLHGEEDLRCPIPQSEEYFVALKRLGKTVEFVRYPNSNHSFRKTGHPKFRIDYYQRMVGWFDRYLCGK
ncbi:MAG: S9 family peptidase [SAR202 cluster bacterium]|nr:S9 family peptidase [SAR202 cluster bacterium]